MSRISNGFSANLNNFKPVSSGHEAEFIGSDFFPNPNQQHQLNQPSCGLARYKSAPGTFLSALLDSNSTDYSSSGDESEAFFSALMSGPTPGYHLGQTHSNKDDDDDDDTHHQMGYHMIKREESESRPGQNNGSVNEQMGYESAVTGGGGAIVGSYSVGMESHHVNGFDVTGGKQNPTHVVRSANNGVTNHMSFSSAGQSSSATRLMPSIPENSRNGNNNNSNAIVGEFEGVFRHDAWNGSPFGNNILKRSRDGEMKLFCDFNCLDNQLNVMESRKRAIGLVHHLSFPKSSTEDVEKFLQFQPETVPCQVRAKRGFATHPRSIAERVRRTRISEKMKKLQDLFPNMDKQTSTADMLDLAVEYIKDLQKQVETLNDAKGKCICSSKPQQT